jgi:hypothetical protein
MGQGQLHVHQDSAGQIPESAEGEETWPPENDIRLGKRSYPYHCRYSGQPSSDERQDHRLAALFAGYGACRLFSISEGEERAGGRVYDAGDLPEDLGWGPGNHRQRGVLKVCSNQ